MSGNRVYTTGETAKICGVNFRTVIRWIERGKLSAYKLPGRGDHRIPEKDLIAFLTENHFPLPEYLLQASSLKVLIADPNASQASDVARMVAACFDAEVVTAADAFAAGAFLSEMKPNVAIVAWEGLGVSGAQISEFIHKHLLGDSIKVIAITAPASALSDSDAEDADAVLTAPVDPEALIRAIKSVGFN